MAAWYTLGSIPNHIGFFQFSVHCIIVCAQYAAYQNDIIGCQVASKTMWLSLHPPFDHELWTRMIAQFHQPKISIPGSNILQLKVTIPTSTRGSQLYVEAFATGIKYFWSTKSVPDRLVIPSKALDRLIFYGSRVSCNRTFLILWFLQFRGYLDPLVSSQKGFDRLITFDPDHKCFYTGHISDYPLLYPRAIKSWRWESIHH